MEVTYEKSRGITLIALVITVIVLMILAGVGISLLTGDKSILQGAQNAGNEYTGNASSEGNIIGIMNDKMNENNSLYSEEEEEEEEIEGEIVTVSDIITDITENNNASKYYGKYVTNYVPSALTDIKWRIFYVGTTPNETENNIYLIADHYVPVNELPETPAVTDTGNAPYLRPLASTDDDYTRAATLYNMVSAYNGSASITSDNPAYNWLSIWNKSGRKSTYESMKGVAYMLDTDIWNKFNDKNNKNEELAKYVIGGAPLEMFQKSYLQVHPDKTFVVWVDNQYGYKVGNSTSGIGYDVSGLVDGTDLWAPYSQYYTNAEKGYNECEAACTYLASPSYGQTDLLMVGSPDKVISHAYMDVSNSSGGFRPVVCLKSSIQLTTTDNGATYKVVGKN